MEGAAVAEEAKACGRAMTAGEAKNVVKRAIMVETAVLMLRGPRVEEATAILEHDKKLART